MTSFSFVHAADLHLGSPLKGLSSKDAGMAELFIEAGRRAFSTLIDQAIHRKVDFVLLAGDVYDGEWKDNKIGLFFNREVARLERAGIAIYLLKGNHDAESVVTRTITLPQCVHEFPTAKPGTFRIDHLKVALHGQGFADRSATENLALSYPAAEPGWFNIGLLHTSLTGREPHAAYAPCSVEDLRSRGYDYWALGHVHDFEVVSDEPLIVFPGNIQGRSIREQGAKGAVLVTVEGGHIRYERLVTDHARFAFLEVAAEGDDIAQLLHRIETRLEPMTATMEDKPLALRLRLVGATVARAQILAQFDDFRDEVQAACQRRHEDIWLEKLEMRLEPEKTSYGAVAGSLRLQDILSLDGGFDAGLVDEAQARIAEIAARLPGGLGAAALPLGDDAAALLAEARDLLLARAAGAG